MPLRYDIVTVTLQFSHGFSTKCIGHNTMTQQFNHSFSLSLRSVLVTKQTVLVKLMGTNTHRRETVTKSYSNVLVKLMGTNTHRTDTATKL